MKYFKKTVSEYGSYVDAEGVRYTVEWCSRIVSPGNETPEELGYEPFENMDSAIAIWGLETYEEPEEEHLSSYGE